MASEQDSEACVNAFLTTAAASSLKEASLLSCILVCSAGFARSEEGAHYKAKNVAIRAPTGYKHTTNKHTPIRTSTSSYVYIYNIIYTHSQIESGMRFNWFLTCIARWVLANSVC